MSISLWRVGVTETVNGDSKISLESAAKMLRAAWSADTAFDPNEWSPENPARGQCLVSSLVVQDYLGGELMSYSVAGDGIHETHHCNVLPGGAILDTTESQYDGVDVVLTPKVSETKDYASLRERYLANDYDRSRYELLKARVEQALREV